MPDEPADPRPNAALTSPAAVVAALALVAAVVVAVVVLQLGTDADPGSSPGEPSAHAGSHGPVREGDTAPDFTLASLDGEAISLSDYAGRPVLINMWASWCPPCREEFPELVTAYQAHRDDGLEILGVTHDDLPEQSGKFVADAGAGWPILPDPDDAVWDAYGPIGPPTSYFVDGDGIVRRVHIGSMDAEQLASHLAAIGLEVEPAAADEAA